MEKTDKEMVLFIAQAAVTQLDRTAEATIGGALDTPTKRCGGYVIALDEMIRPVKCTWQLTSHKIPEVQLTCPDSTIRIGEKRQRHVVAQTFFVLRLVSCMYILDCAMNNHHISLSFLNPYCTSGGELHVHFRLCYE